ncbi:class I SAM-dependent methyltransferase [Kitasatospora cinereorecta]|uniref:SAM-dependent methyltransferase n=1 Tax=Kitasatospora cinereorecta TaxID=285560 RepID=A0ABW0VEB7_9ACTN
MTDTHHAHRHDHPRERHPEEEAAGTPSEYWDARYRRSERIWSGAPNAALVRESADLVPGSALDLGCGEGADAVWLARQGWRVTGVDISEVALGRAAEHAREAGVAERIEWRRQDLADGLPDGGHQLVSAHFLHSEVELPRERILRGAAEAVAPGGVLLVVGHTGVPHWSAQPERAVALPDPDEVLAALDLPAGDWETLRKEETERTGTDPEGRPMVWVDSVLKLRRLR